MYYVMSDIHGSYDKMVKALELWDSSSEHLIIMGDLIDRGPESLSVVQKAMALVEEYPDKVTVLKGNHEAMLLAWILDTEPELLAFYYNESHNETLKSFIGKKRFKKLSRKQRPIDLLYNKKKELSFMRDLPLYKEVDNAIFVHAGIDLKLEDWRKSKENDMLWIRNEFYYSRLTPEKRVFFGHTPTRLINGDKSDEIWVSNDGMKVCIDGGASMGGQLNVVRVNGDGEVAETLAFK